MRALFPDVATQEDTAERRKGPRGTARGMGRVYQRGRIWWVEYWRRGRQYRESAGSQDEAKAWKLPRKRLGEMQARRFVGPQEERVTFEDLERLYLQDYEVRGLRSKTTADLRARHLKVFFGEDRAVDIAPARIRAYQAARLKEKAQAGTVNRETAALHRMFCLAVKAGQLSTIPAFPERLDENPRGRGSSSTRSTWPSGRTCRPPTQTYWTSATGRAGADGKSRPSGGMRWTLPADSSA